MIKLWLMEESALDRLRALDDRAMMPNKDLLEQFNQDMAVDGDGRPRNMKVVGDVASIDVRGVLTDQPSWLYAFFGGGNTTYSSIRNALAIAEADKSISRIQMNIDSPGGMATAEWIETLDAITATTKPVDAFVGDIAASGAYGIAAKADTITAQNSFSSFGSIGVVTTLRKPSESSSIEITSTNAPNKRPNPETETGRAAIVERIDAKERIFIEAVADGRGVSTDKVKSDFGRGGVFLADKALEVGMIDSIAGAVSGDNNQSSNATNNSVAHNGGETNKEVGSMDLATLKKEHPEVFAAAKQEGVQEGVTQERDRVGAFAVLGESSGDMKTAMAAIKDGSEMTATLQATFIAAGMNRNDQQTRETADEQVSGAVDGAAVESAGELDAEDQIAKAVCEINGTDWEGK